MGEIEYNEGITVAVLDRQERLDPKALRLLTYGYPDDVCRIDGQDFPSGRLGNMSGGGTSRYLIRNGILLNICTCVASGVLTPARASRCKSISVR